MRISHTAYIICITTMYGGVAMKTTTELDYINTNIYVAAAAHNLHKGNDIAKTIGMPTQIFYDRQARPSLWRLQELNRACKRLGVTLEWITTKHTTVM